MRTLAQEGQKAELTSGLRKHEWEKHGCCAGSVAALSDELGYFTQGLALNQRYDIRGMLSTAGIHPDSSSSTDIAAVAAAVRRSTGKLPSIHCQSGNGAWYLSSVRVCVDKAFAPLHCPHSTRMDSRANGHPHLPPMEPCPKVRE